jgi:hypothetical protein
LRGRRCHLLLPGAFSGLAASRSRLILSLPQGPHNVRSFNGHDMVNASGTDLLGRFRVGSSHKSAFLLLALACSRMLSFIALQVRVNLLMPSVFD